MESIRVIDDFCPNIHDVRHSALESGFATWLPNKGEVGSSVYEGMNFWGKHSYMIASLMAATGVAVFPNNMFFRVTNKDTEGAYVHSDREWGSKTCISYLSDHEELSGTGFYRHRATGLIEMPTFDDMKEDGVFDLLKKDMVEGGEKEWEQIDFVRGRFNRAVIFHAPLFHSRVPKNGISDNPKDGRMIWACHFHTVQSLNKTTGGAANAAN